MHHQKNCDQQKSWKRKRDRIKSKRIEQPQNRQMRAVGHEAFS